MDSPPSRRRVKLRGKKKLQELEVKVEEEERVRAERASVLADDGRTRTDGVNDGRKERTNGRGSLRPRSRSLPPVFFRERISSFPFHQRSDLSRTDRVTDPIENRLNADQPAASAINRSVCHMSSSSEVWRLRRRRRRRMSHSFSFVVHRRGGEVHFIQATRRRRTSASDGEGLRT